MTTWAKSLKSDYLETAASLLSVDDLVLKFESLMAFRDLLREVETEN